MKYLSGVGSYNARIYINNADYEEKALQTQVKTGHNAYRYGFIGDYSMPLFDSHALLKVGVDGYIDNADVDDQKTVMDLKFDKIGAYRGKQVELYTGVYGANSNSYDLSNIALFAQYENKFMERLNVVVGGRLDRHSEFGTVFNPKAGATYELLNFDGITTSLKANYGKGFRAPTIVGLFSKTLGGYGNPDLKPEKTENFDIGVFQRFADWGYLEVSYFRMNVTNLIINDKVGSTGNGYYVVVPKTSGSGNDTLSFNYRRNLGSYSPSGVEIGLKVRPIKQLTLGGSYTYLDPEDFTFQTSRHRYNFSIYGWQDVLGVRIEGELIYNYTGDGYFFDFEKSPYEAFSTVDLMLAANFLENFRVSFIAKNIADTEYKLWNYEWQGAEP
ncbi:MAG: TonB-dependent receptor [Chlorobiales bacterium]|nr:TonB-dependent receptor [Chlorobiales bacterium]